MLNPRPLVPYFSATAVPSLNPLPGAPARVPGLPRIPVFQTVVKDKTR